MDVVILVINLYEFCSDLLEAAENGSTDQIIKQLDDGAIYGGL